MLSYITLLESFTKLEVPELSGKFKEDDVTFKIDFHPQLEFTPPRFARVVIFPATHLGASLASNLNYISNHM